MTGDGEPGEAVMEEDDLESIDDLRRRHKREEREVEAKGIKLRKGANKNKAKLQAAEQELMRVRTYSFIIISIFSTCNW